MNLAPIALFTYNRPWHTKQVLDALSLNDLATDSVLYIFQDGSKQTQNDAAWQEVSSIIQQAYNFKEVNIEISSTNRGCDASMIRGITKVINKHGKIIVMEDDFITSPQFLSYMNDGLQYYESDLRVGSINAFSFQIPNLPEYFFLRGVNPWGWATWKRGWDLYNPDVAYLLRELKRKKQLKEWDYGGMTSLLEANLNGYDGGRDAIFCASLYLEDKLGLYPSVSFVRNIGFDGSGEHCGQSQKIIEAQFASEQLNCAFNNSILHSIDVIENQTVKKRIKQFYGQLNGIPITYADKVQHRYLLWKHQIKKTIFWFLGKQL